MASEADCWASTVLEALRVASTAGHLAPGEAEQHRHADRMLPVEDTDWGRQIRNSKFEISAGGRHS